MFHILRQPSGWSMRQNFIRQPIRYFVTSPCAIDSSQSYPPSPIAARSPQPSTPMCWPGPWWSYEYWRHGCCLEEYMLCDNGAALDPGGPLRGRRAQGFSRRRGGPASADNRAAGWASQGCPPPHTHELLLTYVNGDGGLRAGKGWGVG